MSELQAYSSVFGSMQAQAIAAQNQLSAIMSPQAQAMMQSAGFGYTPAQLQNAWIEKADSDYESAIRELNEEFPGLRY